MEIREMKPRDAGRVKPVLAEALESQQAPETERESVESIYTRLKRQELPASYQGRIRYMVAEEESKIVGLCVYYTYSDGFARYADLRDLYVVQSYRNRGVGSALLSAAKESAKEDGCVLLIALPPHGDKSAVPLLRKHGFEKGEHVPYVSMLS